MDAIHCTSSTEWQIRQPYSCGSRNTSALTRSTLEPSYTAHCLDRLHSFETESPLLRGLPMADGDCPVLYLMVLCSCSPSRLKFGLRE